MDYPLGTPKVIVMYYKKPKMKQAKKDKLIDDVISEVGNLSETKGLVKNEAAHSIKHLLGEKAAKEYGESLDEFKRNPEQYSVMFKDGGLRLRGITAIAEKGRTTNFPVSTAEIYNEFDAYMNYCETLLISPSIVTYATWLGIDREEYDKKIRQYESGRPELADALKLCKEVIHGFVESQALNGYVPPAVYLHQNKAYYNAVETSEIKHGNIDDSHVRSREEVAQIIDMLPSE